MPSSLPADPPAARRLTGVVAELAASVQGESAWFAPVRSTILVLVDGLGRGNLTARAGHARFLTSASGKKDTARTVFPSTTAAALASLLTGTTPGEHGLVGYRVRDPETGAAPTLLRGWETHGLDPLTWQRVTPFTERLAGAGRPVFAVSRPAYARSGFTTATQRGATFVSAADVETGVERAAELAARHDGAFVYLYIPDLDMVGHARGWESDAWADALERVDAALSRLHRRVAGDVGVVVTADHGMVDVPKHRQILIGHGDPRWDGVQVVAGEPRMLHLYCDDAAATAVAAQWRAAEASRSWVFTRAEAIEAGLFGPHVADEVRTRIGDVMVAARADVAYYDDRESDKKPQSMVGQHGSLTDQERIVPLIRLGAYAR